MSDDFSIVSHTEDDRRGMTLEDMEKLCEKARNAGAPDDARLGAVTRIGMSSPPKVRTAVIRW